MSRDMYAQEIWNNVAVWGPQTEIDRLKKLCALKEIQIPTSDIVVDFSGLMPECGDLSFGTWNRVTHGPHEPGTFSFGFDNSGECCVDIFERLAEEFPDLAFHCSCIGSQDEFMASGWFNGPADGETFEYSDVPKDYWGPSQDDEEDVDPT